MNGYFLFPWCWSPLLFDSLSVLVVRGGAVCLPTPPSWFFLNIALLTAILVVLTRILVVVSMCGEDSTLSKILWIHISFTHAKPRQLSPMEFTQLNLIYINSTEFNLHNNLTPSNLTNTMQPNSS